MTIAESNQVSGSVGGPKSTRIFPRSRMIRSRRSVVASTTNALSNESSVWCATMRNSLLARCGSSVVRTSSRRSGITVTSFANETESIISPLVAVVQQVVDFSGQCCAPLNIARVSCHDEFRACCDSPVEELLVCCPMLGVGHSSPHCFRNVKCLGANSLPYLEVRSGPVVAADDAIGYVNGGASFAGRGTDPRWYDALQEPATAVGPLGIRALDLPRAPIAVGSPHRADQTTERAQPKRICGVDRNRIAHFHRPKLHTLGGGGGEPSGRGGLLRA